MTYKIIIPLLFLFLPVFTSASVVINEVAWMGTETSYTDEWIELKNTGKEDIDLEGWILRSEDGSPEIILENKIKANSFYLLERTDDNTTPQKANLIYTGALSNKGEDMELIDKSGNRIDGIKANEGWPAGDNENKLTMEKNGESWQNSQNPGGTPGEGNSSGSSSLESKPDRKTPLTEDTSSPVYETYPEGIVFSEIIPSPEGPDSEEETIQIFNQNSFEADLNSWTIEDKEGKSSVFTLRGNIGPREHILLKRPETKITLNNSGDELELKNPRGEVVDQVSFGKAPLGESYLRTEKGWSWSGSSTETSENISSEESEEKTREQIPKEAAVKKAIGEKKSFLKVLLTGLIVAFLSTILFLVVKRGANSSFPL